MRRWFCPLGYFVYFSLSFSFQIQFFFFPSPPLIATFYAQLRQQPTTDTSEDKHMDRDSLQVETIPHLRALKRKFGEFYAHRLTWCCVVTTENCGTLVEGHSGVPISALFNVSNMFHEFAQKASELGGADVGSDKPFGLSRKQREILPHMLAVVSQLYPEEMFLQHPFLILQWQLLLEHFPEGLEVTMMHLH